MSDGADFTPEKGGVSVFKLAFKSIFSYFWMNAKLCFTFACLAFLVCLFSVYNTAIELRQIELLKESSSANYITATSQKTIDSFAERGDAEIVYTDRYVLHNFANDVLSRYGVGGNYFASASFFRIEVEGEQYVPYRSLSFCMAMSPENKFFTPADEQELFARWGERSFFSEGEYPSAAGEIAIGAPMLEVYDLEAEDVLGKEISIYFKNPETWEEPLTFQYRAKVTGIIREEFYSMSGHTKNRSYSSPYFLLFSDDPFMKTKTITRYRAYLAEWPDPVLAQTWDWGSGYIDNYVGYTRANRIDVLNSLRVLASNLYIIIGSALMFGLVLTVFLLVDKFIRVFSRFGGILLSVGMRRRKLFLLLTVQLLILCVIAIPIAILLTAAGYTLIGWLVNYMTGISLTLPLRRIALLLLYGILVVVGISLVFLLYSILRLRNRTIKQLLSTEVR